jgi:hypothetical protein
VAVALAVTALLLAGCREAPPEEQLAAAVERTLDSSFTYAASVEGDRVTEGSAPDATSTAVRGIRVDGLRADGRWSVGVAVLGFEIIDVRLGGEDLRWIRFGAADVLRLLAGDPEADPGAALVLELEARGVDEETREVVSTLMRGTWLRVEGPLSGADLDRALGTDAGEGGSSLREILEGDLNTFVEEYVEVRDLEERRGDQHFDILVETRALGEQLARLDTGGATDDLEPDQLPEHLPGSVVVRDGIVQSVVVALSEGAETADDGSLRMRLELEEHGEVEAPEAPEDAETVDSERFLDALAALAEVFGTQAEAITGG